MKVRFIVNPRAGRSGRLKALSEAVRKVFREQQGIFEVRTAPDAAGASALAAEAAAKGYEVVFACGGDGTINLVAAQLVGTATALGIVPSGSGNALAASLGIPAEPEAAMRLLASGRIRDMDVGVACGRYFFSTAGFAFEAHLSSRYNKGFISRRMRGVAPYFPLALLEYFRFKPGPVRVSVDGRQMEGRPLLLSAANTGQFGGGAIICPDASMDDGLLDICFVPMTSLIDAVRLGLRLLKGTVREHRGYESARGSKAVVSGRDLVDAHVDGEPFEWHGDIELSVLYRKIRVVMP